MINAIRKIVDTFATVKALVDGAVIEIALKDADVQYWATTPDGTILMGVNRGGLDRLLAELGVMEERELARLQGQLEDIAERAAELFHLATLELVARGNEIWFRIAGHTDYGWKFVDFDDVDTLFSFDVSGDDHAYAD